MSLKGVNDAGDDVSNLVSDAVSKGDYSGLAKSVSSSISRFVDKIGTLSQKPSPYIIRSPEDRRTGQLQLSGGAFIAFSGGVVAILMLVLSMTGALAGAGIAAVIAVCAMGAGIGMAVRGGGRISLSKHLDTYARICADRTSIPVAELAQQSGRTETDVRRDVIAMKKRGFLPHGGLSQDGITLCLTDSALLATQAPETPVAMAAGDASDDIRAIVDQGNDSIRTIDACKTRISDASVREKLDRLEHTIAAILEQAQKKPTSAPELRRFMNYYLPTTTKLVSAYVELDAQRVDVVNVTSTKAEIADTLDTINEAFSQVLDDMFQDTAWDISSDINVMKTMMEQEGLTKRHSIDASATDSGTKTTTK